MVWTLKCDGWWFDGFERRVRCRPLLVRLEESDRRHTAKLGAAVENWNLEDEEISHQFASQLLDEGSGSSSGTTCDSEVSVMHPRSMVMVDRAKNWVKTGQGFDQLARTGSPERQGFWVRQGRV